MGFNSLPSLNMNYMLFNKILPFNICGSCFLQLTIRSSFCFCFFHYMSGSCSQSWGRCRLQASSGQRGDAEGAETWADGWRKQDHKEKSKFSQERQCQAVIRKLVPGVESEDRGKVTCGEGRAQGSEGKRAGLQSSSRDKANDSELSLWEYFLELSELPLCRISW